MTKATGTIIKASKVTMIWSHSGMKESHCPEATCEEMVAGINWNVNELII
jgi:hypothetical protein